MLDLSRCFFLGDSPTDPAVIDDRKVRTKRKVIGFGSSPLTSLFTLLQMFLNGWAPPDGQGPAFRSLMQHLLA